MVSQKNDFVPDLVMPIAGQPRNEELIREVVSSRERLNETIKESELASKQMLDVAIQKTKALEAFREEIARDLLPIQQQLDVIKGKFAAKLYDKDQNPDGVLTCAITSYEDCFDLAKTELERMFEADKRKWETNLRVTQQGLSRMTESLSAFSAEQENKLAQLLNPEQFIKQMQPQLRLRKVPLVGEPIDMSQVNFEWPLQAQLPSLGDPDSLRLRSLYFMSTSEDYQPISRVTCIYDNGVKSPNIQSRDAKPEQQGEVVFDVARPVRTIKMSVYTHDKIPSIGFFDDEGELIDKYDPEGYGLEVNVVERTLKEGEEIIGVYGVKNKKKWFTGLGFIAMKRIPQGGKSSTLSEYQESTHTTVQAPESQRFISISQEEPSVDP